MLVIDDEETIRELLSSILTRFDHDVTIATDGMGGIKVFETGRFDLVLTDLGMPGVSGWKVAQRIRAIDPDAVVILITGWGVELDGNGLKEKGVDFVISKPFRVKQIMETISKALTLRDCALSKPVERK